MDEKLIGMEDRLALYTNGEITAQELVTEQASSDMLEQYKSFLTLHGLNEGNAAAEKFIEWWFGEYGDSDLTNDGFSNKNEKDSSLQTTNSKNIYNEWNRNGLLLSQLSTSDNAATVTLWRWRKPDDEDKEKCALETDIDLQEIEKWWNTIDWLNEYVGGHFHPLNLNKAELKDFIFEACNEVIERIH